MTDPVAMQEYLLAKRSVDDRALNRRVLGRFTTELSRLSSGESTTLSSRGDDRFGPAARREPIENSDSLEESKTDEEYCGEREPAPVHLVELGAGVGTMVARLASWRCLPPTVSYRAVDRDGESIAVARARLPRWLEGAGYDVRTRDGGSTLVATDGDRTLKISLEVADIFTLSDDADAVIASAFLDVVDLEEAIPKILELLTDGGLLYAPITFDGGTSVAPRDPLDDEIERLYHRHMDDVRDHGSSRSGRELLSRWPADGRSILAAGGADWVVCPVAGSRDGYPGVEETFLRHILETIDGALTAYSTAVLDPADRERWIDLRRRQLERARLVYVAHNLDVLARA